ncbi:MAG TPA: hypothetical protein VE623_14890 [Acidimicrobiales bacterium]|nr:hypothetical protein [Acidimicrobiales bacterium]
MRTEQDAALITRQESRGSGALWFAVLGSPVAWLGSLGLNYPLEEVFACSPATTDRGEILGFGVDTVSWTLNSLMALIAAAAGLTALASWRRLRRASDGDRLERSQWMAFAGMVEGAIFLAAIVLGYVPPLLLDTCTTSP